MNRQINPDVGRSKITSILILFITAGFIFLAGIAATVFSVLGNISFSVLNSQVHGSVWGVLMTFLGVRYLISVQRLKAEVYQSTSRFSWSNFRSKKERQPQHRHR